MGIQAIVEEQAARGTLDGDLAEQVGPAAQTLAGQSEQVEAEEDDSGELRVRFDPVLSFEKTDVQFWAIIAQTVLLAYIAYKL